MATWRGHRRVLRIEVVPDHRDEGELEARVRSALQSELGAWRPRRGPDLRDLLHRAERPWLAPVAVASAVAAAALTCLFVLALAAVLFGPFIPGGDAVRARLVGP